jgi:hypothetical protein
MKLRALVVERLGDPIVQVASSLEHQFFFSMFDKHGYTLDARDIRQLVIGDCKAKMGIEKERWREDWPFSNWTKARICFSHQAIEWLDLRLHLYWN